MRKHPDSYLSLWIFRFPARFSLQKLQFENHTVQVYSQSRLETIRVTTLISIPTGQVFGTTLISWAVYSKH